MKSENNSHKLRIILEVIGIITALIAVAGTLGVALINNWDKVFPREAIPSAITTPSPSFPSGVEDINISGVWRDVNYGTIFQITRQGNVFEFTGENTVYLFRSSGRGTISKSGYTSQYETKYQNGLTSTGTCSGTISSDGTQITGTCTDSVMGVWKSSSVRTQ